MNTFPFDIIRLHSKFHRTILTAAHCICHSPSQRLFERENGIMLEGFTTCKMPFGSKSKPTYRLNQYIPLKNDKGKSLKESQIEFMWDNKIKTKSHSFNHIAVKIGSRDFTKGVQQQIQFAYNMYVDKGFNWENMKPDIALVIVKRDITSIPNGQVGPICLPSRQGNVYDKSHAIIFIIILPILLKLLLA